jgi:DNA-binding IscR family transcriptional regulator
VHSAPGPTGGHQLVADLDTVSLLDLIEAVEGPTDDGRCVMATQSCPAPEPCAVHDTWLRARSALTDELADVIVSITTKCPTKHLKGVQP